jgi:hypothetical protein
MLCDLFEVSRSVRMMIETYKRYDGEALGENKVGDGSGENEGKIGDIPEPPKHHHKNAYTPKPNPLRNRLDITLAPPEFPPQTNDFQKPINFKRNLRNELFGKKGEKPSEEKPEPKESPKPKPFLCGHCGRDGHLVEFCFRRKREERWLERWPTRTGTALLVVCLSPGWCREVRVWCVPFTLEKA